MSAFAILSEDSEEVFKYRVRRQEVIGAVGLSGYHLHDLATHLWYPVRGRFKTRNTEIRAIEETLVQINRERVVVETIRDSAGPGT